MGVRRRGRWRALKSAASQAGLAAVASGAGAYYLSTPAARAQTVIATVNDDPVTNIDIEQHTRILRAIRDREVDVSAITRTRPTVVPSHPSWRPIPAEQVLARQGVAQASDLCAGDGRFMRLWPHRHGTDGFFAATMLRSSAPPPSSGEVSSFDDDGGVMSNETEASDPSVADAATPPHMNGEEETR